MASEYHVHWGTGRITVRAVTADLAGTYDDRDGTITRPCDVDIAELLPKRWRKAFALSSGRFWHDTNGRIDASGRMIGRAPYLELRGYRGKHLATLYYIPTESK